MATDNFLDKKSVLGLAERVPMCPPPETIVFADSIQWGGGSFTGGNQYQSFQSQFNVSQYVSNLELIRKLTIGQSIACQIKINGEQEILPLFLVSSQPKNQLGNIRTQYITKGTTVLNDGKIAGVIFEYQYGWTSETSPSLVIETIQCYVYIHYWGTL